MSEYTLRNLIEERIDYYHHFSQQEFNGMDVKDMLLNLLEWSKSKGHDIQPVVNERQELNDDINIDELVKKKRIPFEEMYQYFVQEWRKSGLPDPTKEEVLKMLEEMEKKGSVEKCD